MNPSTGPTAPAEETLVSLYEKGEKVYPREIQGRFQRLRVLAVWVLLGLYYLLPWLNWGGRQLVLFDLPARKFYVFGLVFWPQDFIFLTGLLILAALTLFFFTTLLGRVWCGYACPQTVWTETFLWLERLAEGPARTRKKRDAGPWTAEKLWRKAFKHALWISFALWTGFTFVGYFTPIRELSAAVVSASLGPWEAFWIFFYGFATYGNAGFLREQVCRYMCPYARFQGAMFDNDTLIVSYDPIRGEPRGSRSRKIPHSELELGDCIDCTLCVQVCPTGIDIREGLQFDCIACAACIDACDQVMERMDYPSGLIRYSSQNAIEKRNTRILRPRIFLYGLLLLSVAVLWSWGVSQRPELSLEILRDRNALYRVAGNGTIENVYTLRVLNRTESPQQYAFDVSGLSGAEFISEPALQLGPGEVGTLPVTVSAPATVAAGNQPLELSVSSVGNPGLQTRSETRFFGPEQGL